ncbi:hypothetical protein A2U01_0005550 [Trifolium medium]|uniref:Uncharacterized protein n=1 Tax=Trifolium medium TaxID=97028 RepID=A0A392MC84_9FABA|nr:hypothetical protein [Trifolium medium]
MGGTVICSYPGGEVPPCSADMDVVGQAILDLEAEEIIHEAIQVSKWD